MTPPARQERDDVQSWLDRVLKSRHSPLAMGGLSFLESTVLAVPLELVLIPYLLANRHRLWWIVTLVTLGCLLGALCGYLAGMVAYNTLGTWMIEQFGWQQVAQEFEREVRQNGFLAVLLVGITPVPFQIAMLTAGASGYSLSLFLLAAGISRGIRYFGLALLVFLFGEKVEELLKKWRIRRRTVIALMLLFALGLTVVFALVP
ncbi:MAG: YqaA family protein [Pseudomonadota bacterium]